MDFNYIDVLLWAIILLSVWGGWYRGFILGLADLIRWIGSFLAALFFYKTAAHWINSAFGGSDVWSQPAAFLLIIIFAGIIIQLLESALLRHLSPAAHKNTLNRILGILPGFVNGLITAAIVAALLFAFPFSDSFQEKMSESPTANRLAAYTEDLETALAPVFNPAVQQTLNHLTVEPESEERVELPFKVESPRPRPDLEAQMLELVNQERVSRGLKPLEEDAELKEVARKHSADMFARGYFSHYTPEDKSPFDRMKEANINFTTAGENLALAPTLPIAHNGLMNSPGHRANILNPQFGRVGIGILDGGRRGLMISQEFRN